MLYSIGNTEIFKLLADKLCTIIRYQLVRYAKMPYDAMQELDCVYLGDTPNRLCFEPLSDGVDGNDQELVSSLGLWKRP